MKYYQKVVKFVSHAFKKAGDDHGIKHFERTVYWLKHFKPDADEAFLIAAYAHDIERAFSSKEMRDLQTTSDKGMRNERMLKAHQENGAEIIGKFLTGLGANKEMIKRVKHLVVKHEVGGDEEQNLLKDADSVSFFENNVPHFITKKVELLNKEKVKAKFLWMFSRITSDQAKEMTRFWYESAIKKLEEKHST